MMSAAGPLLMQPHRALQWSLVRTVADSDHRAQAFRFDAAQRSDLIARS